MGRISGNLNKKILVKLTILWQKDTQNPADLKATFPNTFQLDER